ncbi:MAG: sulfatase-like hydrolase/transferase [Armatimonadota bacterium]|nr:sulfatase-like hydrolase/transferase [Armatimonadota bacterium]
MKPNILFFFTDDQRFDTIGALGNAVVHTPNMDRLVSRGTAFTHAHIPCGTSGAVCMPSRAMLHTGRTLFHLEGAGQNIPEAHTTLGEALRQAGYRTFGAGKWHNGTASFHRSFSDGDEIFFGGMADHWNVPAYHYDPTGRYETTCLVVDDPMRSNQTRARRCDHIHAGRHSSEIIADAGVRFLTQHDGAQPFFLYLSFLAPHDPRTMPQPFREKYNPDSIPLPPNFMGGHPFDNGDLHVRDELLAGFPRTPEETRRHIAEYYAMISHLDAQIGRVLDALEARGWQEQTLILFAGDNGLALGQHGLFGKQSCYEHSVRVPLVFAGPGVPQGRQSDALVYLLDVFPTLCDLVDVEIPPSVEGRSMVKAMHNPSEPGRDLLYFAYTDKHRAVRNRRFKLIEYVVNGRHNMTQLFDLEHDPWEVHNLADNPDYREQRDFLRQEMVRLRDAWDDCHTPWGERFWEACRF